MDARIDRIFREEMKGDTSFMDKGCWLGDLFGSNYYSKHEIREAWDNGIKHGIEIGLNTASAHAQKKELTRNTNDPREKEFIEKFYKLSEEYKYRIEYHPILGLVVSPIVKE